MRTKVTLVLVFLNVALFFFIFRFERTWRTEAASQEARRRVLGPEAADIRELEVTSAAPGGSFTLVRNRDAWSLTRPFDWPANARAAGTIINELQLLEHEAAFNVADLGRNGLSLADYGLDQPKLVAAFTAGAPRASGGAPARTELRLGDTTKDGKRLYLLSPDRQRVHIVNRSLVDSLSIPLDQLRAETLLSVRVFEARSLLIQTGGATPIRARIRREGTRWSFETPILARASKTALELALNQLNALRASSFPASPPTPLPSSAPSLRITLEGNNRQETLFLGEAVPGTRPGAGGTTEFLAQLDGRNAVFTVSVPGELLAVLRSAPEALREKRILDFDPAAVTAVALAAPAQPREVPLTLQRLETPAGQTAAAVPPWQVVVRASGEQSAQTRPADRAAIQRLLDQLGQAEARVFKSDAPTSADLEEWGFNRPLREVTLSLAPNQPPVVLRIGTDARRGAYYARVGTGSDAGNSVYEISPELERELPVSAVAWRDRTLTEPLPAAARISALRLTDLASGRTVAEAGFNAAGEPSPAPADATPLRELSAWLRAPRAKSFVPGGFTEKVSAAGDERPWRLQLEATIVLPAATGVESSSRLSLLLTERLGGSLQFAGSKELDAVFALDQAVIDALWALTYGSRDPGPAPAPKP